MIWLCLILISLFGGMLCFPAAAFVRTYRRSAVLLSWPFVAVLSLSALGAFSLYALTGSAGALRHDQLLKTIQAMGGLDAIIRKIEQQVSAHPDDTEGRAILQRLKKSGTITPPG